MFTVFITLTVLIVAMPTCCYGDRVVIGDGVDASSCNFSALLNAVATASSSSSSSSSEYGIIAFNCSSSSSSSDKVVISFDDQLQLHGRLTIDGGNQVILDGGGHFRLFAITVYKSNVTVRNLVLANGAGNPPRREGSCLPDDQYCVNRNTSDPVDKYDGGCVYLAPGVTLTLESVSFVNCSTVVGEPVEDPLQHGNDVTFMGGAVYADYYTRLYISRCSFVNNTALHEGGAVYKLIADAEDARSTLSFVVAESRFVGNAALGPLDPDNGFRRTGGGGAIYTKSSLVVCRCEFRNNSALVGGGGGAIRSIRSDVFVSDSIFVGNRAMAVSNASSSDADTEIEGGGGGSGGAIHAVETAAGCREGRSTIHVANSRFVSNEASSVGAAMFVGLITAYQRLVVDGTDFVGNKVQHDGDDDGDGGDSYSVNGDAGVVTRKAVTIAVSCSATQVVSVSATRVGYSRVGGRGYVDFYSSVEVDAECFGEKTSSSSSSSSSSSPFANNRTLSDLLPELRPMDGEGDNSSDPSIVIASMDGPVEKPRCLPVEGMLSSLPAVPTCPPPATPAPSESTTETDAVSTADPKTTKRTSRQTVGPKSTPAKRSSYLPTTFLHSTAVRSTSEALYSSSSRRQAFEFDSSSFWNGNSADKAMDGDPRTCFVSGFEVTSWWMLMIGQSFHLSGITLTGVVKGDVEVKLGDSYDPIGHPCVSSSSNPTLWKQRVRRANDDDDDALVIDFATPTAGSYLSVKTENIRATQITICEIILRY